ncbi:MAG: hypothetical protein OXC44_04990 [Proteobacteria bacterium]|nr:hypothetical protein [Pseudomonadota bacterium]
MSQSYLSNNTSSSHPCEDLFKDTVEFILETTINNTFLPYEDHEIVRIWLKKSQGDHIRLYLIIAEATSHYLEKKGCKPHTIKSIHKNVLAMISSK